MIIDGEDGKERRMERGAGALSLDEDDGEKGVWEPGFIQPILPILLVLSSFGENGENDPSMRRIRWMEVWCLAASSSSPFLEVTGRMGRRRMGRMRS